MVEGEKKFLYVQFHRAIAAIKDGWGGAMYKGESRGIVERQSDVSERE